MKSQVEITTRKGGECGCLSIVHEEGHRVGKYQRIVHYEDENISFSQLILLLPLFALAWFGVVVLVRFGSSLI